MNSSFNTDVIFQLEAWLSEQCDGDWEHTYGLTIETIDNPGWYVQIDLNETTLADIVKPFYRSERSETDWIQFEIKDSKFIGSGGIGNLREVLHCFLSCMDNGNVK
jgi:hypothetical protein